MTNLAIIGLDAEFDSQTTIDRFDRAIYNGFPTASDDQTPDSESDWAGICQSLMQRLQANMAVKAQQLQVLLISDEPQPALCAVLAGSYASCQQVETLAEAMQRIVDVDDHSAFVVLGFHQVTNTCQHEQRSFSFAKDFTGYSVNNGIAALAFSTPAFAEQHGLYTYAYVKGFSVAEDMATAALLAVNQSGYVADDIKYLEATASADAALAQVEMQALIQAYNTDKRLQTALGCARSVVGDSGALAQVAGLLKTVIAVYQRYFPGTVAWSEPRNEDWQQSPFYFPSESRPWFPASNGKPLVAAYNCVQGGIAAHIVVQENPAETERYNGFIASSELVLVPVAGNDAEGLLASLQQLQQAISNSGCLSTLARDYYEKFQQSPAPLRICLLAESFAELEKEIQLSLEGVIKACESGHEWKTPKGSFFTPVPVTESEGVTFLYPGIGASYVGLGRDIFHLFPEIYTPVVKLADDIGASLKDGILNPRTLHKPGFKELKAMDHEFRNHLPSIAECGVGFSCVFTKIFEEVFNIHADFAAGYSMGEVSMYAALGCWKEPGVMSDRLARSETFNHRLTGDLLTLRQHWDVPLGADNSEKLWETYTLKATPEQIAEACEEEDRVYCTIINTPDSLVIGGYPEACERVMKKLGVRGMSLDIQNAIHSPPAFMEYKSMEELYTMEVNDRLHTKIYSSSCYLPVPQRTKAIANSIAKCLCDPVDFPRLINTMYDKGARIFIEMGPGRSLCSWVDKILKHEGERPHVSVPVNAKGTSDELTMLRAIAKLVSHGVSVNMHSLYYGTLVKTNKG